MNTLAHWSGSGGPGPWILLVPLIWAAVIAGAVILLRRTVWRRGRAPWPSRAAGRDDAPESTPLDLLAHRFAAGEIGEEEYWMRMSVLKESKDGAA